MSGYSNATIKSSPLDYQLLAKMNEIATQRYKSMADQAEELIQFQKTLKDKYNAIVPALDEIDNLVVNTDALVDVVKRLDVYTKQLEEKLMKI